ncbi:hypothetical protein B0H10DRAFT_2221315 [Mycena sp. CBHHK59/15]|nr:hypothetical protein B0H10DRAFT_2221315 [Mycena sp. CBHHK59/15]
MPPKRRKDQDSDQDYHVPSVPKRARHDPQESFFQTSSVLTSPWIAGHQTLDESDSEPGEDGVAPAPLPDLLVHLLGNIPAQAGSTSSHTTQTIMPRKQRAVSETPGQFSSPATSTIFEPSPVKTHGGLPRLSGRATRNPCRSHKINIPDREEMRAAARESARVNDLARKKVKAAEAAEKRRAEAQVKAEQEAAEKHIRAQEYFAKVTALVQEGGAGFSSILEFFDSLMAPGATLRWLQTLHASSKVMASI